MSSDQKKDLTRIEDLGEYLHELNAEDDFEGLPDIPESEGEDLSSFPAEDESPFESNADESVASFESSEDNSSFEPSEEGESFGGTDFGSTDFGSDEFSASTDFGSSEFENNDFGSSEFETSDFGSSGFGEAVEEESPAFTAETSFGEEEPISEPEPEVSSELEAEPMADFAPITDPDPIPEPEPEPVVTPEPVAPPIQEYKAPENFADLKKFAESTSFTGMGAEGNPSFSVLIKNVRYIEDVTDILSLMKELGLQTDSEEQMKSRLMRGSLLVPRISEYAAILLAHKLRRFDIDIQVGLSDEIHPPKHKEEPETGLVSKFNLYQNQSHHFHFDDPKLELSQIIVSATPSLEGHQVVRYLGVASEHKILDGHVVEDEDSTEIPRHYQELAQKLKAHALKAHSNAVVGLNYQLTPLPSEFGSSGSKYRLTCTGNLVWVNKI